MNIAQLWLVAIYFSGITANELFVEIEVQGVKRKDAQHFIRQTCQSLEYLASPDPIPSF